MQNRTFDSLAWEAGINHLWPIYRHIMDFGYMVQAQEKYRIAKAIRDMELDEQVESALLEAVLSEGTK
jgi:hypothetical protein